MSNWSNGVKRCKDCNLLDYLYKDFCKPCFDKRGMQYERKDILELLKKDE